MRTLKQVFKIQAGEGRMVALLMAITLIVSVGGAVGSPGVESLFFTRFGVDFLPAMYISLGIVTVITSLVITLLIGLSSRRRLYGSMPLILAIIMLVARLVLGFDFRWFYPPLWLWMNMMWTLQALFTWGLAGMITNTRQAKRLFPLFGAGGILGVSLGGLATQPLVAWLGSENLLLVWSAGLLLAFFLAQVLLSEVTGRREGARVDRVQVRQRSPLLETLIGGFHYVRGSQLLRWLSVVMVLFAVLFYSLSFPFSKTAAARFPDENALSGFLGLFQGITTGAAFLASLFIANRLYARFGITAMVLAYTGIYLGGFLLLSAVETFYTLVFFRFVQIFWYQGIASSAYQAIFNAVPPDRRDQTRTFIDGVPGQLGVSLAGGLLLISDRLLTSRQLFLLATGVAALTLYAAWRSSRSYRGALVAALRAGHPRLFETEDEPFRGFPRDATAVAVVVDGIHHPDPVVRRVSAEILGNLAVPEAVDAMVAALKDEDAGVRAAVVRSLARSDAAPALLEILSCLEDEAPEVRGEAVKALRKLAGYTRGVAHQVRPLLADPDPGVRARAAVTLLEAGEDREAVRVLDRMMKDGDLDERLEALEAVTSWGSEEAYEMVHGALHDDHAVVRQSAAVALAATDPARCLKPLAAALGDEDAAVQTAVAEALGEIGAPAREPTLEALNDPEREAGALQALAHLPLESPDDTLRPYARDRIDRALYYHRLSRRDELRRPEDRADLLRDSLSRKALRLGHFALQAVGLLGNRVSIEAARLHLASTNLDERANALEILENIDEAALVRPLLKLWEQDSEENPPEIDGWLPKLLEDPDDWIRACAALFAGERPDPAIRGQLETMARRDSDEIVRETARVIVEGEESMETLQTLSAMERILFLRRVPLFADLAPSDLKRVASISRESLFEAGEMLVQQGDPGDEMYIIVSGEVSVSIGDDSDHQEEVARRGPGEYVGEMAIISQEPRMASLVAVGEVRVLSIDQGAFERLLRERPEASMAVMRVLCQRLREETKPDPE